MTPLQLDRDHAHHGINTASGTTLHHKQHFISENIEMNRIAPDGGKYRGRRRGGGSGHRTPVNKHHSDSSARNGSIQYSINPTEQ